MSCTRICFDPRSENFGRDDCHTCPGRDGIPTYRKCSRPKCNGDMKPSKAIQETYTGIPDFPGDHVVTVSAGGPGRLIDCMKCEACGWSVTR